MKRWQRVGRRALRIGIPVGVVGTAAVVAFRNRATLASLADLPLHLIFLVAVLTTVAFFINSTEFFLLYRSVGLNITNLQHWLLYSVGQLGNYLPGQVGTLYRVQYLKKNHGLDLLKSAAVYGTNFLLSLTTAGVFFLLSFIFTLFDSSEMKFPILVIGVGFLLLSLALLKIDLSVLLPFKGLSKYVSKFDSGRHQILEHKSTSVLVLSLEIARLLLGSLRMMLLFSFFGIGANVDLALWLTPLGSLTTFVALTPGGLGLRELVIGVSAGIGGDSFGEALAVATSERAINLPLAVTFGLLAFFRLRAVRKNPIDSG